MEQPELLSRFLRLQVQQQIFRQKCLLRNLMALYTGVKTGLNRLPYTRPWRLCSFELCLLFSFEISAI